MLSYLRVLPAILLATSLAAQTSVTKIWQTDPVLQTPESILYHPAEGILFISNINGQPTEKDGNGFISKLGLDGNVKVLRWATGLNAPKGACISGGKFYVTDIDVLAEIDLKTGKLLNRYPAPGAVFLNDAAADENGNIYFTDSSGKNSAIYRFGRGKMERWLTGGEINRPNGLHCMGDHLLVGNSGDGIIKLVALKDKKIMPLVKIGWGIDGLRPDGSGGYLISDWAGRTALVFPGGRVNDLLNTTDQKINSADLEYIPTKHLLLIPTFFDNRVVAYRLNTAPEKNQE